MGLAQDLQDITDAMNKTSRLIQETQLINQAIVDLQHLCRSREFRDQTLTASRGAMSSMIERFGLEKAKKLWLDEAREKAANEYFRLIDRHFSWTLNDNNIARYKTAARDKYTDAINWCFAQCTK